MRILLTTILLLLLLPLGSCSYFWLLGYPREAQREAHGEYVLIVYTVPTMFTSPELVFGSLHNNTTINVALFQGATRLAAADLVTGEDLPRDHLPVATSWSDDEVSVTEPKYGRSITFALPGRGA